MVMQEHPAVGDRAAAGTLLAERVERYLDAYEPPWRVPLVLAKPSGGMPIGLEIARRLGAEIDVVVAATVGRFGAVTPSGPPVFDRVAMDLAGVTEADLADAVAAKRVAAARRLDRYRFHHPPADITGRLVIVVADWPGGWLTASAVLRDVRRQEPERLIFAATACAAETFVAVSAIADDVICLTRSGAGSLTDAREPTDREVRALLGWPGRARSARKARMARWTRRLRGQGRTARR
jgi:predicted phosphoribosyltransferase